MLRSVGIAALVVSLSGCGGDPLAGIARLDEVEVVDAAPVVEAVAAPGESDENVGFFQRLLRKRQVTPETEDAETEANGTDPTGADGAGARSGEGDAVQRVSLGTPETTGAARSRGGWFTGRRNAPKSDLRDAAPGERLPFGEVARACHMKGADLGLEVAAYPERRAKYRVFDSAPGTQGLHAFYVTGFDDGCPRQFTAALAVFGSAGMYEALRYALPPEARTKKPTDLAYEKVKSGKCGVRRGKPCGKKISRVEKDTVFLSVYDRFEGAQGWTNLLISDGRVVAMDSEG